MHTQQNRTSDDQWTVRDQWHGIYVLEPSRVSRDISGHSFMVHFEIVDSRPLSKQSAIRAAYNVTVSDAQPHLIHETMQT